MSDEEPARIEELFVKYLREESVERILALYYAYAHSEYGCPGKAPQLLWLKFGSTTPLEDVNRDLASINIRVTPDTRIATFLVSLIRAHAINLLVRDASRALNSAEYRARKVMSILLLIHERLGKAFMERIVRDIREFYELYVLFTGEALGAEYWKDVVVRALARAHIVDEADEFRVCWTPWWNDVLKGLEERLPRVKIEFETPQVRPA